MSSVMERLAADRAREETARAEGQDRARRARFALLRVSKRRWQLLECRTFSGQSGGAGGALGVVVWHMEWDLVGAPIDWSTARALILDLRSLEDRGERALIERVLDRVRS